MFRLIPLIVVLATAACDRKVAGGSVDGARIYATVCARCHGPGGEPNNSMIARYGVKSLRTARVRDELKDSDIRDQILKGSTNKQMPSFEGAISEEQVAALVAHLRTFTASEGDDAAGGEN